jgi:putative peptidoglycan lipid II flippase
MADNQAHREESDRLKRGVTKAAGSVGLATFLSRISGFLRDMVIAHFFGARDVADAFFMAFRIPNLLRRYTAEGALTAAWVPVFSGKLAKNREEAFLLARNVLTFLAVSLTVVTIVGMVLAPQLVRVLAPGFHADPAKFQLTVELTRMMLPFIIFISLAAALLGMANSMGSYFIPAAAPVLLNLSVITCAYIFQGYFASPVKSLAVGVLLGGAAQLVVQYFHLFRLGFSYKPSLNHRDKDTIRVGTLMAPAALGMAAVEINMLVDSVLASFLPPGSVSFLYYGNRVVAMPTGIFGGAFGLATLPAMSGQVSEDGSVGRLVDIFSHSLRITLLISIPAMVGLIILSGPITNLLFERGQFDQTARFGSAYAMAMYAIGLPAFTGIRVVANAFYSMKDTATPAKVGAWCVVANLALCLSLVGSMAHGGLALATSLAAIINISSLVYMLRRRLGRIDGRKTLNSMMKITVSSVFMGALAWAYSGAFYSYTDHTAIKALHMGAIIILSLLAYFAILKAIKCEETDELWEMVRSKISRIRAK